MPSAVWRTGARISNQNFNFVRKQTCIPFSPPFTMNPPSPPRRVVTAGGWGQAAESPALLSQRCPHPCPRPQQGHSLPVVLLVHHGCYLRVLQWGGVDVGSGLILLIPLVPCCPRASASSLPCSATLDS